MTDFNLESLTSPLAGDAPCGANFEHAPEFLELQRSGQGEPERQTGNTVVAAKGPDWDSVYLQALQLAQRTRDLRVAVWLVRSGARVKGLPGAVDGLQLARALLENHWPHVHPQLDAGDNDDPTERLNALLPLVHANEGLADLRAARLTASRTSLCVRDIELALGRATPWRGETPPTEEGVLQGVAAALAESAALNAQMQAGVEAVRGIVAAVDKHLAGARAPDFASLERLLDHVAKAASRVSAPATDATGAAPATTPGTPAAAAGAAAARPAGAIASREDVIQALQRICEWIETNEPSNPAPLLIRRAQGLMSKSFLDIIRDLAPDGLGQVQKLAGTDKP